VVPFSYLQFVLLYATTTISPIVQSHIFKDFFVSIGAYKESIGDQLTIPYICTIHTYVI
jgi:hypothetical protein